MMKFFIESYCRAWGGGGFWLYPDVKVEVNVEISVDGLIVVLKGALPLLVRLDFSYSTNL